ncbi:MAG: tRNA adenosine(34) deaminase TadA [Candidatus Endonucleobacter bathymodioli]|uniref:tRNA-specific adenosine deaminase n=1 Tax=Candidatus Endonucleibacter bathymodioli TaxID=539814 RepID=A0AA90NNC7_9GAMM|nr:tRNA adenosine(34) deaminase TadA [Candidatus Endonucleobacter bathymodioli]
MYIKLTPSQVSKIGDGKFGGYMSTRLGDCDSRWMYKALAEAREAALKGEVPVGAVVVFEGGIIGKAHNQSISGCNPAGHAEVLALQAAAKAINNYRLIGCDLFVTLEPCTMCAGAIIHSRVRRVVYGAAEPKAGAIDSVTQVLEQPQMNYRVASVGGVLAEACGGIVSDFFKRRRCQSKEKDR